MATPLLVTKLYIPPARPELVRRPHLVERLSESLCPNQGFGRALTLISAPAGFGKTTLLSEWIGALTPSPLPVGEGAGVRVAWLSLDESDNDPARFLAYFAAALHGDAPQPPSPPEELMAALINQLSATGQLTVLVLDDYHFITTQAIHDALAFLLDHMPANLHLVIATRADPPLPLPRLRARGQLTELRQADLRFTPAEAAEFLRRVLGVKFSTDEVAALASRTEGWIAGLQLAAVSMQGRDDVASFIRAFTGSNRHILDYLGEEVLQRQSEDVQRFLLQTSILEQLCGPLCDAVLAADGSQAVLEYLERANLFVVPLDDHREWYRYHRLFAELLRSRLQEVQPSLAPTLHLRASEWCEHNGQPAAAIEHALSAGDFERATRLVEQVAQATLVRGEMVTFLGWMDALPDHLVHARPTLGLFHAWALLLSGHSMDVIEARLESISRDTGLAPGKVAVVRAFVSMFQGQTSGMAELCRQALAHIPEDEPFWRNAAAWMLSASQVSEGDFETSCQTLADLALASQQSGDVIIAVGALNQLAEVHMRLAQLHQAKAIYERALSVASDKQGRRMPVAGTTLIGLGELEREWNDLDAARSYLVEGIELAAQWPAAAMEGYLALARVRQAQGNAGGADDMMQSARQAAVQFDITEADDWMVAITQTQLWVMRGNIEAAIRWSKARKLDQDDVAGVLDDRDDYVNYHLRKYEYLVWVRVLLAQRQAERALGVLEALRQRMEQQKRTRLWLESLMLEALALSHIQSEQALDTLERALSLAEPGGYVRLFVDEGEPMRVLISDFGLRISERHRREPTEACRRLLAYVERLLTAFGSTPTQPGSDQSGMIEPLSERELEVLRLLPTELSNAEMADELVVSVNTLRTHLKNLYGKLGAHSRYEAIARAKEAGWL
ncbi:MAG: tetratricopeptide repeat protein [Thermoflexales bacterium]|nr:tetratricopeptide repeat protein [Thermoflexales bacterium]